MFGEPEFVGAGGQEGADVPQAQELRWKTSASPTPRGSPPPAAATAAVPSVVIIIIIIIIIAIIIMAIIIIAIIIIIIPAQ